MDVWLPLKNSCRLPSPGWGLQVPVKPGGGGDPDFWWVGVEGLGSDAAREESGKMLGGMAAWLMDCWDGGYFQYQIWQPLDHFLPRRDFPQN